jgi:hypothetical protein
MATAAIVTEFNGRNGTDELRTGNPLAVHSAASAEAATPDCCRNGDWASSQGRKLRLVWPG